MPVNSNAVGVAVTGAVYRGKPAATAPTGTASALAPASWDEMGWISEDGITRSMPGAGDAEVIKGWQNGGTVRVIRTPSDENPTFSFVMLETNKATVEATFGVTLTQTATEGSYVINTNVARAREPWAIDVIDGAELSRYYVGLGEVTEVGETTLASTAATAYEITIECHFDQAIAGQVKVWETRLKTA